ncbi:helix-turn-helix domain-containing protein [Actinoplanes sp. HUAS TT8]|uniref:helix-turn-helix domain-containing protein n=1 Tax=Actinoplanes sp. HUAS TT8 TaxID=3447453 RepID=UPI003F51AFAB
MTPPPRDIAGLVPTVFTIEEAAEILRVKRSWLEKKAASNLIPFSMLGGSYHFSSDHLWQILFRFEEMPAEVNEQVLPAVPIARQRRHDPSRSIDPQIVPLRPRSRRLPGRKDLAA